MMMRSSKVMLLIVAFLLPIGIFIFLKTFGKNEFDVPPLYADEAPVVQSGCVSPRLPYRLPPGIVDSLHFENDSLVLVMFGTPDKTAQTQLKRVTDEFKDDALHQKIIASAVPYGLAWKQCIFFLNEPYDLALVDRSGAIRGQYTANDREEVDRLLTELTIILKKY
jgi:hypothetical protein